MTREPDRFDKQARELVRRNRIDYTESTVKHVAAALRQAADDALERAAQDFEEEAGRLERDARKLDADGQGAGAAAHFHYGRVAEENAKRIRAMKSPAAAPAAEEPLGFCDWPGFKDHPHKKQEDHGRSDAEGNPLGCKNWRPVPPSEPVAPAPTFVSDLVLDALQRCERARSADVHPPMLCVACAGEAARAARFPAHSPAPSLLPRVLAALEKRGQWPNLATELRRYIAEREADSGR